MARDNTNLQRNVAHNSFWRNGTFSSSGPGADLGLIVLSASFTSSSVNGSLSVSRLRSGLDSKFWLWGDWEHCEIGLSSFSKYSFQVLSTSALFTDTEPFGFKSVLGRGIDLALLEVAPRSWLSSKIVAVFWKVHREGQFAVSCNSYFFYFVTSLSNCFWASR